MATKNLRKMRDLMTLLIVVVLMTISQSLWAQSVMTDEQKQEAKARYMEYREKLDLTDEQALKVEEINSDYFEGLAEIKNSNGRKLSKYRKFRRLQSESIVDPFGHHWEIGKPLSEDQ